MWQGMDKLLQDRSISYRVAEPSDRQRDTRRCIY